MFRINKVMFNYSLFRHVANASHANMPCKKAISNALALDERSVRIFESCKGNLVIDLQQKRDFTGSFIANILTAQGINHTFTKELIAIHKADIGKFIDYVRKYNQPYIPEKNRPIC